MQLICGAAVLHARRSLIPGSQIAEPAADPLSEAELSVIWGGQRFPAEALRTPDGRAVEVVHPGRRGSGPGPDFRDAIVRVDGVERRGDVELHVRASYFGMHGHTVDPAYSDLALHVVYMADDGVETAVAGGGSVPVAALEPWLSQRREELARWLGEWDSWREPCRTALWRLSDETIATELSRAGKGRFWDKATKLGETVAASGEDEGLWQALLDAVGVGGDREAFRRLALRLPASLAGELLALFEDDDPAGSLTASLVAALDVDPASIRVLRPLNRPERRLAAVASLFVRAGGDLASYARRTVMEAESARALVEAWVVGAPALGKQGSAALLGRERAQELVTNVVLPFSSLDPSLAQRALSLLASLPAGPAYGKTLFLEKNLVTGDGKRRVRTVLEQQGLLAFLSGWCSQGGCGRCPLS